MNNTEALSGADDDGARAAGLAQVGRALQFMQRAVNDDAALVNRARFLSTRLLLLADSSPWRIEIVRGRIDEVAEGPFVMPSVDFRMSAPVAEWLQFWQPLPPPGSHDLFAMLKRRVLVLDGNLHPLMSHLMVFKMVLATPRAMPEPVGSSKGHAKPGAVAR